MCSMKIMLCMALLVAMAVVAVSADPGKESNCCKAVSPAKPKGTIVNFLLQNKALPCVEAVIFITEEGKMYCSSPKLKWVTRKVTEISAKRQKEALENSNE